MDIIQDGFLVFQQPQVAFPVRNMGKPGSIRSVSPQVRGHDCVPGFLEVFRKSHVPVLVFLHAMDAFYHSFGVIGFINS